MNKKEYKIGDKVRIKNIKQEDSDSYIFGINSRMKCYANKVLTIDDIYYDNNDPKRTIYKMLDDEHYWNWSISMFVPFNKNFIDLNLVI